MAEYRVPSTTKVEGLISTHAATPHGGIDEAAALLLIEVDANLSTAAQAAITASHTAPTYDGVNDEIVFTI